MDRILLGQLGANGDCLYATILARQIRHDFPDAHLTWAISPQARDVVRNNPHIDAVWEVPIDDWAAHQQMWPVFEREALRRYKAAEFDHVVFSQIWPNNFQNYDGTVRSSILRAYGRPISVPIENVIVLTGAEIDRVDTFARNAGLAGFEQCILFECSSKSGQSFVTPDIAQDIADAIYRRLPDACVIFNTNVPMQLRDRRSRYAGQLTLRESAHLTHYCTLFIGCGSGGTVAATSSAARALPNIQLLSRDTSVYASFAHDFEYFGIRDRDFVELTATNPGTIADVVRDVCRHGIAEVRGARPYRVPVTFDHYMWIIETHLLVKHQVLDAARSLLVTTDRYGWTRELIAFAQRRILPHVTLDASWLFPSSRRFVEVFRAGLAKAEASSDIFPLQGRYKPAEKAARASARARAAAAPVRALVRGSWSPRPFLVALPAASNVAFAARLAAAQRDVLDTEVWRERIVSGPGDSERSLEGSLTVDILAPSSPAVPEGRAHWIRPDPRPTTPAGRDRTLAELLQAVRGEGAPGEVLVVGEAEDAEDLSALLASAGIGCRSVVPGYGTASEANDRRPTQRPAVGSFFAWLSQAGTETDAVGTCIFVGPRPFDDEVAALDDKASPIRVLVGRTDSGEVQRMPPLDEEPEGWPRITIVTPSFNQADYLEATIRSVLDQDYPNLDFILVDGGSTDGSVEIIERYRLRFSTVIIEPDRGQSDALNKGFAAATGTIMNWLCSDDLLEPGALRNVARAFLRHAPDLVVGGCLRIGRDRSDEISRHHTALKWGRTLRFDPLDFLPYEARWQSGDYFFQPEVFFSREVYERSGAFIDERLYYLMDYELWLRMALSGATVRHIPHDLGCSRVHAGQKTRERRDVVAASPIMQLYHDIFSALDAALLAGHVAPRSLDG